MIKLLILLSLVTISLAVLCEKPFLTAPYGPLDLTITVRLYIDGECDYVLTDGVLNYDTLTLTSNQIIYTNFREDYNYFIADVDVGYGDRYCAIDDFNGVTNGVCVGQANGTKTYPGLLESYKQKDTLGNSYNPNYINNVSIVIKTDTSYQFETTSEILNRYRSDKITNVDLAIGGVYQFNNVILTPVYRLNSVNNGYLTRLDGSKKVYYNYQFLDGSFEDCVLGKFQVDKLKPSFYADCSTCGLKYTNNIINDKILYGIDRCRDLKNNNISYVPNVIALDLFFDYTILGVQPPFATMFQPIPTPLSKLTLLKTQNGGQCVIEPQNISDKLKTINCDLILNQPSKVTVPSFLNGLAGIYEDKIILDGLCKDIDFSCATTTLSVINGPSTSIYNQDPVSENTVVENAGFVNNFFDFWTSWDGFYLWVWMFIISILLLFIIWLVFVYWLFRRTTLCKPCRVEWYRNKLSNAHKWGKEQFEYLSGMSKEEPMYKKPEPYKEYTEVSYQSTEMTTQSRPIRV